MITHSNAWGHYQASLLSGPKRGGVVIWEEVIKKPIFLKLTFKSQPLQILHQQLCFIIQLYNNSQLASQPTDSSQTPTSQSIQIQAFFGNLILLGTAQPQLFILILSTKAVLPIMNTEIQTKLLSKTDLIDKNVTIFQKYKLRGHKKILINKTTQINIDRPDIYIIRNLRLAFIFHYRGQFWN